MDPQGTRIDEIKFKIIGKPITKGRPRFFRRGKFVGTYTPTNTRQWENLVRLQAALYRSKQLWQGPVIMSLTFMMPRPKSLPKKVVYHIKKPDLDNLTKAIKDALQGIIYRTDSQIIILNLEKKYTLTECGVVVKIAHILKEIDEEINDDR